MKHTSLLALSCALALLASPTAAQAATLSYSAATQILTYTGSAGENVVFADHPSGDSGHLRIVDVGGESLTSAGAPACVPDDIDFYLVCPTPAKLVVNLGGGDDYFSDDTTGGGDLIATPVEVNGGAGADEFDGGEGPDTLRGGAGIDAIRGDGGNDILAGDEAGDTLDGGPGHDDLTGGIDDDRLTGGPGNDAVRGADGDDELDYSPEYAFDGADAYEGGGGTDTVGYFGRTVPVRIDLNGQADDGQAGENDNIGADVEIVDGGDANDVLIGSAGANGLAGRAGDDQISGLGGNDLVYGDSGGDTIDGGDGDDDLDGGCHDDVITGGAGVDSLNSDGTCADPALRGLNDVLYARDGVRDALVLCTVSGTPGDTAVVDTVDPALPPPHSGACRTIDAGTVAPPGTTTPGSGAAPAAGTAAATGSAALSGTLRARLGATLTLLSGTGKPGQAARQGLNLKAKPATLTLGTLVATSAARLTAGATIRARGRKVSLGSATSTIRPGSPRALKIRLSSKAKAALRTKRTASVTVRFVVRDPATRKIRHQSAKTFRVTVRR